MLFFLVIYLMTWIHSKRSASFMQRFFSFFNWGHLSIGTWKLRKWKFCSKSAGDKFQTVKRETRGLPFFNMPRVSGSNPPLKTYSNSSNFIIILYCYYYILSILRIHYCYKCKLYYWESVTCAKVFLEKIRLKTAIFISKCIWLWHAVNFVTFCHHGERGYIIELPVLNGPVDKVLYRWMLELLRGWHGE